MNTIVRQLAIVAISAIVAATTVAAQQPDDARQDTRDENKLEEIVVVGNASRLPDSLASFAGSVSRIGSEEIRKVSTITNDISQILALQVPGIGISVRGSASNFDQSIRGRVPSILIDGIPVGTPLRDGRHDVRSLSPQSIQSIEVIRGASALYGNGGGGGVVNYITKRGAGDELTWQTEVGTEISLTSVDDSLAPFLHQTGSGSVGAMSFNADFYTERTDSYFDADGSRIRPSPNGQGGLAESEVYSAFLRLGYNFGSQSIDGSVVYYNQEQDSKYNILVPGDPASEIPVSVQEGPKLPGQQNPLNKNFLLNVIYTNDEVFGSSMRAQAYYQDYENVFDYGCCFFPGGGQSTVTSEKNGFRIDFKTPLAFMEADNANVLWGVDVVNDETGQNLADGRTWAPPVEQTSIAGFLQASFAITDAFNVNAGFRYESIDLSYPGFVGLFSGVDVPSGESDYTADTFNIGLTYALSEKLSGFAAFSQGFSVAEVGRLLRQANEDTNFSTASLEASIVDNYEIGLRYEGDSVSMTVATFFAESALGTAITNDLRIARQPEEIYGVEVAANGQLGPDWDFGATFTWTGGRRDSNGDGSVDRDLGSNRVNPAKLTGFLNHELTDMWSLRLQVTHSAGRNLFEERLAFAESPVEPFTLIDGSASANFGDRGRLTLGISNLTNEDYFTVASYFYSDTTAFSKGKGIGARITYSISY